MYGRTASRLAWGIAFGCFAMAAAGLVLLYLNRAAIVSFNSSNVFGLVAAVTFGALGGVVASRRHDRRHRTARGNDPGNDRDGRGLRGGPEAARGERTPRRDRVGEAGDRPHEVPLCRGARGERPAACSRCDRGAEAQGDAA